MVSLISFSLFRSDSNVLLTRTVVPFFVFCHPESFTDVFQTLRGDARVCSLVLTSRRFHSLSFRFYSHFLLSSQLQCLSLFL